MEAKTWHNTAVASRLHFPGKAPCVRTVFALRWKIAALFHRIYNHMIKYCSVHIQNQTDTYIY